MKRCARHWRCSQDASGAPEPSGGGARKPCRISRVGSLTVPCPAARGAAPAPAPCAGSPARHATRIHNDLQRLPARKRAGSLQGGQPSASERARQPMAGRRLRHRTASASPVAATARRASAAASPRAAHCSPFPPPPAPRPAASRPPPSPPPPPTRSPARTSLLVDNGPASPP
jgi:hypothetical protein